MGKLKLYNVVDEYIDYLRNFDRKVFSNKEDRRQERKYLGVVLKINDFNYFVPLSSPKDSDYILDGKKRIIRKSIVPIMRMIVKDSLGNEELKGTLKFSNMIPIPDIALINYDLEEEEDKNYRILILKELSFINKNTEKIIKNALVIYNQKSKNLNINYLKDSVDFKLLEIKCRDFEKIYDQVAVTIDKDLE